MVSYICKHISMELKHLQGNKYDFPLRNLLRADPGDYQENIDSKTVRHKMFSESLYLSN